MENISSAITCEICMETMNLGRRKPVSLPDCGHTFCRFCIINISNYNGQVMCPSCRCIHKGMPPEQLPVNWTLMKLLDQGEEEKSTTEEALFSARTETGQTDYPEYKNQISNVSFDDTDPDEGPSSNVTRSKILKGAIIGTAAVASGAAAIAAAPVVLGAAGFTSAGASVFGWGMAASSQAVGISGILGSVGAAAGGAISAASSAILGTSGAAAGLALSSSTSAIVGTAGGAVGGGAAHKAFQWFNRSSATKEDTNDIENDTSLSEEKKDNDVIDKEKKDNDVIDKEKEETRKMTDEIDPCSEENGY